MPDEVSILIQPYIQSKTCTHSRVCRLTDNADCQNTDCISYKHIGAEAKAACRQMLDECHKAAKYGGIFCLEETLTAFYKAYREG